ncbi:hypothetical protein BJ138DRAFT_1018450, partial [Hygrophoropsis aurantiaca]
VLFQRLKARFPTAHGLLGHRLFLPALMLASRVICYDTYCKKSWSHHQFVDGIYYLAFSSRSLVLSAAHLQLTARLDHDN